MSYTDDSVLAKLSALSETQDSIVTVAQWIMFHRRHADRTVQLWLQRLKESNSNKRLNLIYLANEVTQQSKARHKDDFLVAFSPVIAEATATAYKGAANEVQQRIRRVVDVWRERGVFEEPIQAAVENRISELDKARGQAKATFGGSLFGNSAALPSELTPLNNPQQNVTKIVASGKGPINSANQDYVKLMGPDSATLSAPVFAARLNGLLKSLANAEGAVEQSVKARSVLVAELQKILDTNKAALAADEAQLQTLKSRRSEVDDKKRDVEMAIMAGLSNDEAPQPGSGAIEELTAEPDLPEVEALTPPEAELDASDETEGGNSSVDHPNVASQVSEQAALRESVGPGIEILSDLASHYRSVPTQSNGSKKRRLEDRDDAAELDGDDGIDADVAEMLREDNGSL